MKKSLDELYEEVSKYAFKFKPDLIKTMVTCCPTMLNNVHPVFNLAFIPAAAYLIKTGVDLSNVISKLSIQKEENIYNSLKYLKYEREYFVLIGKLQKMLEGVEVKEPMEIFAVYHYLVVNGYLSINHIFNADNIDSIPFNFACSIFSGVGVCRSLSPLLTDLLKQFTYNAYNVKMFVENQAIFELSDDHFSKSETEEVKERIASIREDILKGTIRKDKVIYNHVSTLLANGDESYIMDSMNNTLYLIDNNVVYPYCNPKEPLITKLDEEWSYRKKVIIPSVSSVGIDNLRTLEEQYVDTRKKCDECIDIFEKFYLDNKGLYQELIEANDDFSKKYIKLRDLIGKMI